jgi:hypothetical protein
VLSCGSQAKEVTVFGTCRCVSGQFWLAFLCREVLDWLIIPSKAGYNIGYREILSRRQGHALRNRESFAKKETSLVV